MAICVTLIFGSDCTSFKNSIISKVGDALEVKRKDLANTFVRTATTKTEVENTDDAEV